ncbi:DNA-directed RNA polymerase III, subunit Rpc31 [Cyathus striatus]|nr:DNA-directed RNA polymerase III, subunit Rpc31 [Cyathus striatus]
MSRGGRGGGRGGFRGGRSGFPGGGNQPPMGLTFADLQNLSREATELYPSRQLPVFTEPSSDEKRIAELQLGFASRLKTSQYYVVEKSKSTELPRYSDKYRLSASSQPTLKRKELHEPFFPPGVLDGYFNPKRKHKLDGKGKARKVQLDLDNMADDMDEEEKSTEEKSDAGSQVDEEDYDVDEEYDNDYAENYFDNGEGDDNDDLGGGGDDGGGEC